MDRITSDLVKRHMDYLKSLAPDIRIKELSCYETIYDHMLFYFTNHLFIEKSKAISIIDNFRADMVTSQ